MKIYIGTDHAGFALKEVIKGYLVEMGHTIEDKGALSYADGDDYPMYIAPVADAVAVEPESFGIIFGHSGQGEAMCANRQSGARAALYYGGSLDIVRLAREHNNANILSLGSHFLDEATAKEAVALFLATPFSGEERHARRIAQF